jgi:hypothetical protein
MKASETAKKRRIIQCNTSAQLGASFASTGKSSTEFGMRRLQALLVLALGMTSFIGSAACVQGDVEIEIRLDRETFEMSYDCERLAIDPASVRVYAGGRCLENRGEMVLENDGAGNFSLRGQTSLGFLYLHHDHETWHRGVPMTLGSRPVTFENCDWDDLFVVE